MKKERTTSINVKLGGVILVVMLAFILVGFFYTPYDPDKMNGSMKFAAPSAAHLFGCDQFGRDVLSRVMSGIGTTFFVAVSTVAIGAAIGTVIGAITGFVGGWVDEVVMRFNDVVISFPSILLALVFISILGTGKYNVVLALGIIFIPSFARIARSEFIANKEMDYMYSARLMGVGTPRRLFVHLLPNALPVLFPTVVIGFNNAVLAEAGMSYLGIGVQPPDASLGRMLSEAQAYIGQAPWCAIFPGLAVILLVLGFGLVSDGIQD